MNVTKEVCELVGGPYDGLVLHTLGMLLLSYNLYVYRRSARMSVHGVDVYCYDHVGHRSEEEFKGSKEFHLPD